ncbi:MAG: hypothetical protein WC490_07865 [Candidatus Margulisiibacteriota bacterium]
MNPFLKYLNPVLFLLALIQIVSVALLISAPSFGVLGIHKLNGLLLLTVIAIHFSLNWPWIKATYLSGKKK